MNQQHNTITTRQDDTISRIAYDYYGSSSGNVEAILSANPKLASYPVLLPAGITIVMPAIENNNTVNTLNLWD